MRLLRLVRLFWGTSLAAEMEYRVNFLLAALTSAGNLVGSVFALYLFYRTGYSFAGWRWEEALVVLGLFTLLDGLASTLLRPNLRRLVRHVELGTLDFVLLKPIDSQLWLSLRNLSPWGLPDMLLGAGIIVWAGGRLDLEPERFALALPTVVLGGLMLYSLWFILGTTCVWFVKIYNITEVLSGLLEAGRFPIVAYPVAWRVFFTFVVPVAFMTTVPAQLLLGRSGLGWLLLAAAVSTVLLAASVGFWRFALRHYTSASS